MDYKQRPKSKPWSIRPQNNTNRTSRGIGTGVPGHPQNPASRLWQQPLPVLPDANQSRDNANHAAIATQTPPLEELALGRTQSPDTDAQMSGQSAVSDLMKDTTRISENNLTQDEIGGIASYVGGSYEPINNYLRSDKPDELKRYKGSAGKLNLENDKKVIENMKSAFTKAPKLTGDVEVYRGLTECVINDELINLKELKLKDINKITKDSVIFEKGFMSTSVKKEVAIGHCKDGGALLRIKVPKGTPAFYVTKELENRKQAGPLRHESEIIFGVNQKIKITKVVMPRAYYIIDGELQMQDGGAAQQKRRTSASG